MMVPVMIRQDSHPTSRCTQIYKTLISPMLEMENMVFPKAHLQVGCNRPAKVLCDALTSSSMRNDSSVSGILHGFRQNRYGSLGGTVRKGVSEDPYFA